MYCILVVVRFAVGDGAVKPGRGISEDDVFHVVATGDYLGADKDGLMWWLGETETERGIEVAGAESRRFGNTIMLIHSMPMEWRKQ